MRNSELQERIVQQIGRPAWCAFPGCIYDPFRDELFTATRGNGAFLNGLQMTVGDQATIGEATVACGSPPGVLALGPCIRGLAALAPHVRTVRMLGSAGEM